VAHERIGDYVLLSFRVPRTGAVELKADAQSIFENAKAEVEKMILS
jgi:hypothetical protein